MKPGSYKVAGLQIEGVAVPHDRVGGGAKVSSSAEAAEVERELQPRRVIPVQYVSGKPPAGCDQGSVPSFLEAMAGTTVRRSGGSVSLAAPLGDGTVIEVLR